MTIVENYVEIYEPALVIWPITPIKLQPIDINVLFSRIFEDFNVRTNLMILLIDLSQFHEPVF